MNRDLYEKEKGFVQLVKWSALLYGLAMIALGVLLILYPNEVMKLIGFIIGAAACVYGVVRMILYFAFERKSSLMARGLFAAIFFIAAGVFALINRDQVVTYMTVILGVLLFVDCLLRLQESLILIRLGDAMWWLLFVFALITAGFSVLLILKPEFIDSVFMTLASVFLIIDGVFAVISMILSQMFLHGYKKGVVVTAEEKPVHQAEVYEKPAYGAPSYEKPAASYGAAAASYEAIPEPSFEQVAPPPAHVKPEESALPVEPVSHVAEGPGDTTYGVNPASFNENLFDPDAAGDIKIDGNKDGFNAEASHWKFDPETGKPLGE